MLEFYSRHGDTYLDAMARYLLEDIETADDEAVMPEGELLARFGKRIAYRDCRGFVRYWRFETVDAAKTAIRHMKVNGL